MTAILHPTADNPIPPGKVHGHTVSFFEGPDGRKIRYAIFRSDAAVAKGTVVVLQGRNESIEKYFETIGEFLERGLWVATFDWRGQGGSDRIHKVTRRGHVRRFSDYERDLSLFLEKIVLPDTRLPFFMVAHSMGALVALSQAPYLASRIDRLAVLAPFVELGGQAIGHRKIGMLAAIATWLGFGFLPLTRDKGSLPFSRNLLTHDPARFSRNTGITEAQAALALGPPSARWLHETFKAIRRITRQEHLTQIRVPTILLAPTQDRLVPYRAMEALARNFRAGHLIPIDGARHELLHESDLYRAQAIAAIEAFIPGNAADLNEDIAAQGTMEATAEQ